MSDKAERRRRIVNLVRREGTVYVSALASDLHVATETVRRDLTDLEKSGMIRRTHGVVHPVDQAGFETTLRFRSSNLVPEKRRIAAATASLISDGTTIYLDDGYTPQLVAEQLVRNNASLTVVTPSIPVAAVLASSPLITSIVLGGRVRPESLGSIGHWVFEMLTKIQFDVAIVGTNAVCLDYGLTAPDPEASAVKALALHHARNRILVSTHAKFGRHSFSRFAHIGDIQTIVTDSGLRKSIADRYQQLGPEVLRV